MFIHLSKLSRHMSAMWALESNKAEDHGPILHPRYILASSLVDSEESELSQHLFYVNEEDNINIQVARPLRFNIVMTSLQLRSSGFQ